MRILFLRDFLFEFKKYGVFYILILLHFPGGVISNVAVLVSSIYSFYYFATKKHIDLYLIFLLLFTNIALGNSGEESTGNNFLTALFNNVVVLGPLAISTKFFFVLAIPFRIVIYKRDLKVNYLFILWLLIVLFSLIGLLYSYINGAENKSGLTVGFRIALVFGIFFLRFPSISKEVFYSSLSQILRFSLIVMSLGIVTGHWIFIMIGFIPYAWVNLKSKFYKLLILFTLTKVVIDFQTTVTVAAIFLVALIFYIFYFLKLINSKNTVFITRVLVIAPLLITAYVIYLPIDENGYNMTTIEGYTYFKLFGDRKPIWDASFGVITNHNFFIAPAGSRLDVYFDYIKKWKEWEEGSHNIFLEIGRQISFMGMLVLSILVVRELMSFSKNLKENKDFHFIFSVFSIYTTFGLSGQSIIYDGVGFMFWLLIVIFRHLRVE
jgi:hypothetical protein